MKKRWHKFIDGIRYAFGHGTIGVSTNCPYCDREIETEVD